MTKPKYAELVPPELYGKLDFLAQLYCPAKKDFTEAYADFEKKYNAANAAQLHGFVPSVSWGKDLFYTIDDVKTPEKYPWVVTDTGFSEFFQGDFLENPEKLSWFTSPPAPAECGIKIHPLYEKLDLTDPKGKFGIFGSLPYLFVVNHNQLKGRKPPVSISDLTKSEFESSLCFGYGADDISEVLMMEIHKEQGEPGVRALAKNLGFTGAFTDMQRSAEEDKEGIAVYLMYSTFAERVEKRDFLEIVWPSDPIIAPLYALYKAGAEGAEKRAAYARFLYAKETGDAMAKAYFSHINAAVVQNIPASVRFRWVGWDYVYEKPATIRAAELEKVFYSARESAVDSKKTPCQCRHKKK